MALLPAAAGASTTFSFPAQADTYVSSAFPDTAYGTEPAIAVDGSPVNQAFLRFDVQGLEGMAVVGARLRLFSRDGSDNGGRVFSTSATGWDESTTWTNRPSLGGQLGSFGAVATGNYYEASLTPPIGADGVVALAIDSPSSDAARWATREAGGLKTAPRLILEVDAGGRVIDGLSQVAGPNTGSSEPTYYGTQHRLAVTEGGRTLTVHGLHATGVGLAWRDPAGNWQSQTTGSVPDGTLLSGTQTGDWPASIAIARDSGGSEHAWVVFAGETHGGAAPRPVYMRRLSNLDAQAGPSVGPLVVVDAPALGAYKPDISFEQTSTGGSRGVLIWSRRASDSVYETVAGWFTNLDTDQPVIEDATVIDSGPSPSRWGALVPSQGMKIVARFGGGGQVVLSHSPSDPLTSWSRGPAGISASGFQSATALDSGELVSVVESNIVDHVVSVQRFTAAGDPLPVELSLTGYSAPSIASDGTRIWIVMIRQGDGSVVSRQFTPGFGWDGSDRVEIGAEGVGDYNYPNLLRRTDGRLRLVVEGPGSATDLQRSSVLAFQRGLDGAVDTTPPDTTITSGPSGKSNDRDPSFGFSSEPGATFECSLDGPGAGTGSFASCPSPMSYADLADGSYRFEVRAIDSAGNIDATPDSRTFTIATTAVPPVAPDTDPPETEITKGAPKKTRKNRVTFKLRSDEPGSSFECRLDKKAFMPCASPRRFRVKEGKHTFLVRATDGAGNTDFTPAKSKFRVVK